MVFDILLNVVVNLGYVGGWFLLLVFFGDMLIIVFEVIGKKENFNGKMGVVYVWFIGYFDDGIEVFDYVCWVMVNKCDLESLVLELVILDLLVLIDLQVFGNVVLLFDMVYWDNNLFGLFFWFVDYEVGEKIDYVDGMMVEEVEYQMVIWFF